MHVHVSDIFFFQVKERYVGSRSCQKKKCVSEQGMYRSMIQFIHRFNLNHVGCSVRLAHFRETHSQISCRLMLKQEQKVKHTLNSASTIVLRIRLAVCYFPIKLYHASIISRSSYPFITNNNGINLKKYLCFMLLISYFRFKQENGFFNE